MAAAVMLTDTKIKNLKAPEQGRVELADTQVPGLRVRIGAKGQPSFIIRKRVGEKVLNLTLGKYGPRFGLGDARAKARSVLNDIEAGGMPKPRGRAPSKGLTVRYLFEQYCEARADKKRSGKEIRRIFDRYILPEIGDRLADAITRADVTNLIDEVARGGARETPVMARNVAAQLSAFYSWAMPRLERLESNPCRDADKPEKPKSRERVLSDDELQALWQVADGEALPWGPGIKLLILTGQRRDEVFNADRSEFDLKAKLWTIPGERAKNGKAHLVPLSDAAVEIVKAIPEVEISPDGKMSPKLFPARSRPLNGPSGFSKAWARVMASLAQKLERPVDHATMHDIRRTLATGLQRLGIRLEVTEAVLNHISGTRGGLAGVYQRHHFSDEKRFALDAWAAEVARIVAGKKPSNVVALKGNAA